MGHSNDRDWDPGRGWVEVEGDEGGERPAARRVASGSVQNTSWSFSVFQLKCRRRAAAVEPGMTRRAATSSIIFFCMPMISFKS